MKTLNLLTLDFDLDNDIQQFFSEIEKKISSLKNWSLSQSVVLSLFSFLKINMYNDFERNDKKIKKHPIVRALCGDTTQLADPLTINPSEYEHDKKNPADIFQVLDADSSQQDAIVSAKNGLSFVLQGPPGTGKSQTIANIIAECLANGRKVLFVSEKVAALDVVFKRLSDAGIGDFCLSLHSHKSNKKEIIEQLGNNLGLASARKSVQNNMTQVYTKLFIYRTQLNNYTRELHAKRLGLQKSVYEIYGELIRFSDNKDIVFSISNIDKITNAEFENIILTLEEYCLTLQKNTREQSENPWYGSTIKTYTYELEYKIKEKLNILFSWLSEIIPLCDEIKNNISLNTNNISNALKILNDCSNAVVIPYLWINSDVSKDLIRKMDIAKKYYTSLSAIIEELDKSLRIIKKLHPRFEDIDVLKIKSFSEFNKLLNYFKSFVRNDESYAIWEQLFDFNELLQSFDELQTMAAKYNSILNEILVKYDKDIMKIDAKQMLKRFQLDYSSLLRFFNAQFHKDRKLILSHFREITKDTKMIKNDSAIHDLKMLCELKALQEWFNSNQDKHESLFGAMYSGLSTNTSQLNKKIENFKSIIVSAGIFTKAFSLFSRFDQYNIEFSALFSFYFSGLDTNWNELKSAVAWAEHFISLKKDRPMSEDFIRRICEDTTMPGICKSYYFLLLKKSEDMLEMMHWFYGLFEKDTFKTYDLKALSIKIKACEKNIGSLYNWIDYNNAKEKCNSLGLASFISEIENEIFYKNEIIPVFKKYFFKSWIDFIMKENEILQNFRGQNQDKIVSEFRNLDKNQIFIAKQRIREKLIEKMPYQDIFSRGSGEIKLLQKELNKKRRIMPLRKLFQNIPDLLLALKPCLMMSPLTVSLFLESSQFNFDTVIFDEASQVCTENAIGAISRGKQVILAGDSKQLPPTTFFTAVISDPEYDDEDKDDYTEVDSYESILDEAVSFSFPSQTLKWHYRSRNEHLIAFSNAKIYNNKLITFPSNIDNGKDNGVEYIYIQNGIYDRGGKRDNIEEAKKVVGLIFEHIENFPNRSMGVITFSVSQQETIETVLRKGRLNNPKFEFFFNEEKDEPFFIKNIETVQGDERDTIIFSIGYGKDHAGKMSMFFGPLSSTGGERRLNVAITRAKYNIKLVGSITPQDIKTEKITSEGPKLLRSYIDFAINGQKMFLNENYASSDIQMESPFEQSICDFLIRNGYKVSTQIGCSGYRIDMGIHKPNDYSSYCLGIECDGETYHSARTARERDRLRQSILEDMGWKLYRIWSTDWLRNQEKEREKLIQAVNSALS
ncbi:AAA domain-containing protein [Treponema sp. TIM-1]|uniref:AAA domain-containing protein n=1 Tax=Treponema sp. TIM-1 TaxID=2898417 RepID=UPI00397EE673